VRVLAALQPLRVRPKDPVFTTTEGQPIEPKAFASRYWYRLRALGLRVRGIYATLRQDLYSRGATRRAAYALVFSRCAQAPLPKVAHPSC
jgi:hypothetical protein